MLQLNHIAVMADLQRKYLSNYPNNLPKEIQEAIIIDKPKLVEHFEKTKDLEFDSEKNFLDTKMKDGSNLQSPDLKEPISFTINMLEMLRTRSPKTAPYKFPIKYVDFEYAINAQELVMLIGYTEGFIDQSVELMYKLENELCLKYITKKMSKTDFTKKTESKKKFLFSKLLGRNISKRLQFLEEECNLNLIIPEDRKKVVSLFEEFRHIIVHKSGIVDQRFINQTGLNDQSVGERIHVNENMNRALKLCIISVTQEVFSKINSKYFYGKI